MLMYYIVRWMEDEDKHRAFSRDNLLEAIDFENLMHQAARDAERNGRIWPHSVYLNAVLLEEAEDG